MAKNKSVANVSGDELVGKAYKLFDEFYAVYASERKRLEQCEQLYLGDHWTGVASTDSKEPRPVTPIMQSTIENLASDLMDRYPEAIILPETTADTDIAATVGAYIKRNHDSMCYRNEFRNIVHDLLTCGYCLQEVGYDTQADNGLGAAYIRYVDIQCAMVDPQVTDIQDGRAVFKFVPRTIEWLEQRYPEVKGKIAPDQYKLKSDNELTFDSEKSVFQIEYWWREYDAFAGQWRVHMAQMAGHCLLADSRVTRPEGYFAHGEYPFVLTPLFRRKGSALGYGMCDMFGEMQKYSDKLDQIVMKNAVMASRNKILVTGASGFDAEDLRDWSKDVHRGESLNGVTWFTTPPLPNYLMTYIEQMRMAIKEESGANDWSRGNTSSGVTAASAIYALQEAGGKRSRMMVLLLHEAFRTCVRYEVEAEREFGVMPKVVRYTKNGQEVEAEFSNALMTRESEYAGGVGVPIEFFISIKVQQENPFKVQSQNDFILQAVQLGVIPPQLALECLTFDGKEEILEKLRQTQGSGDTAAAQQQAEMEAALQAVASPQEAIQ